MKVKLLVIEGALCFMLLLCPPLLGKLLAQSDSASVKKTVTGKILDADGKPLDGATVAVKGTSMMVVVKPGGLFSVPDVAANAVLEITAVGFETQEVAVNGQAVINVSMKVSTNALDAVVVVGYGARKKSDVTGAVASIGSDDIKKRPVQNMMQAMQGKVPGVDITSAERPGQLGNVTIRGTRSLNALNGPLYVVDGIPMPVSTNGSGTIEGLNPNDIESVDVLKDASATAIYGSRGANGVIIVTTKQGKKGKTSLSYVGTMTVENLKDRMQMMNSAQYIDFRREAYRNIATNPYPAGSPNEAYDKTIFANDPTAWANVEKGWASGTWNGSLVPTTDWTGMVTRTGITQDNTISVSSGTDKSKTYASFGYLTQTGTIKGQGYKRYTGKYNTEVKPTKWFTMGGNLSATFSLQNYGFASQTSSATSDLYIAARGMLPYAQPFDSNGNRIILPGGDINISNAAQEDQHSINERKVYRTTGMLYGEVEIIKGLKYRINFGADFLNNRNGIWYDEYSINRGAGAPGSTNYAQLNNSTRYTWNLDNLIYYDKTFNSVHNIGVTLLQNASSIRTETSSMTGSNLPWDSQKWYQLNSISALNAYSSGLTQQELTSYMARVNYGYDNKYLLTVSGRWDGASQLAAGHKWDFFPSSALAWKMDQEDFIHKIKWINQLKLRLGFGVTGNAAINPYATKGGVQALYYTFGKAATYGYVASDPSQATAVPMANLGLGWEHTAQFNLGTDFGILQGRITGSIDVYTSKTTNLLLLENIPSVTGYTTTWGNVGSTQNKGIDIGLSTENVKFKDFTWTTNLTLSAARNKITALNNGIQKDYTNKWFVGQRSDIYYDYVKTGIWQNTQADAAEISKFSANGTNFKAGSIKVADQNHDYKIDANNDRAVVGHFNPNWTGGITNTFSYKNFDLSIFIFSRLGYYIQTPVETMQGRYAQRLLDYWTPTNATNAYPAPNYNSAAGDQYASSMTYQNASYIKIRNIALAYNLSKEKLNRLHLTNCKLYVQVTNPGYIYSKAKWFDPDLSSSSSLVSAYNRGVVFGLNVGL